MWNFAIGFLAFITLVLLVNIMVKNLALCYHGPAGWALGKLGVLVSSVCKTEIMHVKIRWCVSIWDNAWHWIDTGPETCVLLSVKTVYVRLWVTHRTPGIPVWRLYLHFENCIKGGCICAHLGSPVCLLLVWLPGLASEERGPCRQSFGEENSQPLCCRLKLVLFWLLFCLHVVLRPLIVRSSVLLSSHCC